MAEWGDDAVKKVKLSKEQYSALLNKVVATGEGRLHTQGKINEADYLAGAMATMAALGITCPIWPLMIMTDRS